MKYYEIHSPYYALVKADDETKATEKYIEVVAGREEEFEEIREEMNIVNEFYAIGKLVISFDETGQKLSANELIEIVKNEVTEILLMDGALL